MVVLHEIGHRVMVWWTRGWCRKPDFSPVYAEAGTFIEQRFIGNDVAGWSKSKVIGDFKNLKCIGIVYEGQSKLFGKFDNVTVSHHV